MKDDLYHFYESDMNKSSVKTFLDSLPPRPQNIFRRAVNCYVNYTNVLQGYRGPSHMRNGDSGDSEVLHESHGLQEIRFWYGTTKLMNWVPGYGWVTYGAVRAAQKARGELEWSSLYFDGKTGECLSHDKDEAAEKLNKIGLKLFGKGDYTGAAEYHDNAYRACSRGYHNETTFRDNAKKARSKLAAEKSSRESTARSSKCDSDDDDDFRCNAYREDRSSRQSRRVDHDAWDANLRYDEMCEPDWYYEGQMSFDRGDYRLAEDNFERASRSSLSSRSPRMCCVGMMAEQRARKYRQARGESLVDERRRVYEDNIAKANAEVEARELNREGNVHFRLGEFGEALDKYQEAVGTSRLAKERQEYSANEDRARNEIDADRLNYEGNKFFRRGNYNKAMIMYRQASVKSQVAAKKNVYTANREKAQAVVCKLTMLDASWQRAWDAENDENDRSEEARQCFEELLRESNECIRRFPGVQRFKQYEILVTLKIEGNEIFNQGLESQLDGTTLFQEALELKQQEKYERANAKFLEAKNKFLEAQQKFRIGSETDSRFKSCVEYVQGNINEVTDSMKIIEECILSSRLSNLDTNSSSANHAGATYFAHI